MEREDADIKVHTANQCMATVTSPLRPKSASDPDPLPYQNGDQQDEKCKELPDKELGDPAWAGDVCVCAGGGGGWQRNRAASVAVVASAASVPGVGCLCMRTLNTATPKLPRYRMFRVSNAGRVPGSVKPAGVGVTVCSDGQVEATGRLPAGVGLRMRLTPLLAPPNAEAGTTSGIAPLSTFYHQRLPHACQRAAAAQSYAQGAARLQ